MFSAHNGIKLEIKNETTLGIHKYVKTKEHIPNYWCPIEETKMAIRKYFEVNENGNITHQNLWVQIKQCLQGIYSCEYLN